jgi:hypothetical protein
VASDHLLNSLVALGPEFLQDLFGVRFVHGYAAAKPAPLLARSAAQKMAGKGLPTFYFASGGNLHSFR